MRSNDREEIVEVFDALSADLDRALELDFDALTPQECVALLRRCEVLRCRLPAVEHPMVNRLAATDPAELGPRRTLTGEPLQPVLPAVATAQHKGQIGPPILR